MRAPTRMEAHRTDDRMSGANVQDASIVAVESGYGEVRLGTNGVLFDVQRSLLLIEGHHAVPFRIAHPVREDDSHVPVSDTHVRPAVQRNGRAAPYRSCVSERYSSSS